MGRCIVRDPQVFLFDEPLSNLDAKLRVAMRAEIKELHQRLKTTSIYVTHDQIEAMTMADQIVVMHDGRVEQVGSPLDLYDLPGNRFVAGFIGSPAMNFIDGMLDGAGGGAPHVVTASGARLPVARAPAHSHGKAVVYGIRPEHLDIVEGGDEGFEATVIVVEPSGSETQVLSRIGKQEVNAVFRERHTFSPGAKVRFLPRADCAHVFDASNGQRI
jgi:multiple sugar transport system ATP-binding protein